MSELTDVSRKLVAVFAADVEGYSRLMGADEVGTLKGLTERRDPPELTHAYGRRATAQQTPAWGNRASYDYRSQVHNKLLGSCLSGGVFCLVVRRAL